MKKSKYSIIFLLFFFFQYVAFVDSGTNRATRPPQSTTTASSSLIIQENPTKDENDPLTSKMMHPVSRLYLISSKQHQMEPNFKVITVKQYRNQNNHIVRRDFQVQIKYGDKTLSAWGQTKKDAKRKAAIAMLKQMGLQVDGDN